MNCGGLSWLSEIWANARVAQCYSVENINLVTKRLYLDWLKNCPFGSPQNNPNAEMHKLYLQKHVDKAGLRVYWGNSHQFVQELRRLWQE